MGEVITIQDRQFKPFISEQQISEAVKSVSDLINADLKNEKPLFLVVLNGAFMFAADLLKEFNFPCEVSFIKLTSYSGVSSSGTVNEIIGLNDDVKQRTVVIVEDIVDTGLTMERLVNVLTEKQVKEIKVATALLKPGQYKKEITIDYIGIKIPDNFVVGYGLDYMGFGRHLKEIYALV
jgi:hypoxanthine phosphoribosyltransferase